MKLMRTYMYMFIITTDVNLSNEHYDWEDKRGSSID